jgi:hypothetical protein
MYQEHKRHWEAAGYTYPYPSVPESMSHWQQAAEVSVSPPWQVAQFVPASHLRVRHQHTRQRGYGIRCESA